jgi:HEPN domain-containing protein
VRNVMGKMDDARNRFNTAEERLKALDQAGALKQAQEGLELTAKALLESLAIDYTIQRQGRKKEFMHDVSAKLPEAFAKLEPKLAENDTLTRINFARLAALLRITTAAKDLALFGIPELQTAGGEIFDYYFAKDFVKSLVESSRSVCTHFWYNWYQWKL